MMISTSDLRNSSRLRLAFSALFSEFSLELVGIIPGAFESFFWQLGQISDGIFRVFAFFSSVYDRSGFGFN